MQINIPTLFSKAFLVRKFRTALQTFQIDVQIVETLNNVHEYLNFHPSLLLRNLARITVVVNLKIKGQTNIYRVEKHDHFFSYLKVCGAVFFNRPDRFKMFTLNVS